MDTEWFTTFLTNKSNGLRTIRSPEHLDCVSLSDVVVVLFASCLDSYMQLAPSFVQMEEETNQAKEGQQQDDWSE